MDIKKVFKSFFLLFSPQIAIYIYQYLKKPLRNKERLYFIKKMEQRDFNFTPEEERKLINAYHHNPPDAPWPPIWQDIWNRKLNAIQANCEEANNIWYSLPYASQYEKDVISTYKSLIDYGKRFAGSLSQKSIGDVGCGKGGLLCEIHNQYPTAKLYGLDMSTVAIDYIKKNRLFIEPILHDIKNPPLLNELDLLFCLDTLEHIIKPDEAVLNLLSLVKKGGAFIVSVPNGRFDDMPQHIHFWSQESWGIFIQNVSANRTYKVDLIQDSAMPGHNRNVAIIFNDQRD